MIEKTFGRRAADTPPRPADAPSGDEIVRAQRMDDDMRRGQSLLAHGERRKDRDPSATDRAMVFAAAAQPLLERRGVQTVRHLPDGERTRLEAIWHACFSGDNTFAAHVARRPPEDSALLWELRTRITRIEAHRAADRQSPVSGAGAAWQPPPGTPADQADAWVRDHQGPAYGLYRRFPDKVPTLSYLGGAPTLPQGLTWPLHHATGLHCPFLGQIDLSALPPLNASPLPTDGVLFFFLDPGTTGPTWGQNCVLFTPDRATVPNTPAPVPADLPALGGDVLHGGFCFGPQRRDADEHRRTTLPQFALDIAPVVSVRTPDWDLSPPDLRQAILHRLDSLDPPPPPLDTTALGLPPGPEAGPSLAELRGWAAAGGPWPLTWGVVELLTRRVVLPHTRLNPGKLDGPLRLEADTLRDTHRDALLGWRAQAEEAGRTTTVPEAARLAFRSWIVESFVAENLLWLASMGLDVRPLDPEAAWTRMSMLWETEPLRGATLDALALTLDLHGGNPYAVPTVLREAAAPTLRPQTGRHQMLGHGLAALDDRSRDSVLLFQLNSDSGLLVSWGDSGKGTLEIRIAPEDLAACDFHKATARITGG